MINTVPPASNSVFQVFGRLKNGFDKTKLIFQVTCLTVVQWSRSCLHVQINWVPLPAMLFSVSLYFFFSVWSLFFDTIFPFGLFSFILTADPADHEHWSIYILCLSPKFYFGKGISRSKPSPWSAYWPSLQPEKTISCQDMSLLWNSWTFLNVSWHHDKQHTVHHKLYF